jgi:hypothetical protein
MKETLSSAKDDFCGNLSGAISSVADSIPGLSGLPPDALNTIIARVTSTAGQKIIDLSSAFSKDKKRTFDVSASGNVDVSDGVATWSSPDMSLHSNIAMNEFNLGVKVTEGVTMNIKVEYRLQPSQPSSVDFSSPNNDSPNYNSVMGQIVPQIEFKLLGTIAAVGAFSCSGTAQKSEEHEEMHVLIETKKKCSISNN